MPEQTDRETLDAVLHIRVPSSLHKRILMLIPASSTVSDYARNLLFAATATVEEPTDEFVSQTFTEECDTV